MANNSDGVIHERSQTVASETPSTSLVTVGRVYKQPQATMALESAATQLFLAILTTSLMEEGEAAMEPVKAAAALYARLNSNTTATTVLRQSHEAAWSKLYASRIEVGGARGDPTATAIAAAVNSSMYYLLSAAREDWPFSTSPGGLANNAYLGHTFWDLATWQYPALAPLYPGLGASLLAYREQRLGAAKSFAQQTGHVGARFPWESAVSQGMQTIIAD